MNLLIVCLAVGIVLAAYREKRLTLTTDHFVTFPDEELPGLSIVIAARDEEKTVGASLESLLNLDYPDLQVVFVDDRSTDRTYEIASALAKGHPRGSRLTVLRCESLPAGWLGKIHAQYLGARASRHPLVLFTDADVVFEAGSLERAVSAQRVLDCDHLVVAPQIETRGFWEPVLVAFFFLLFAARFRPSLVHRKRNRYVGVGAFNLLTRSALEDCGFLEPLRLQVIDDVHLGRLIKSKGMTQYCLVGRDDIKVRWFEGLSGCIKGLEKNSYAGVGYNLPLMLAALPFVSMPFWLPLTLLVLGKIWWAAGYLLFLVAMSLTIPVGCRLPQWVGLGFPLAAVVLTVTFARSAWLAERRGGIIWRGTRYELGELKRAHREFVSEVAPL